MNQEYFPISSHFVSFCYTSVKRRYRCCALFLCKHIDIHIQTGTARPKLNFKMATSGALSSIRASCAVCLEPLDGRHPKVLPCFHTFCSPCLDKLVLDDENDQVIELFGVEMTTS